ncbi:T9SS type A sorting domain-containing protein [Mesonia sp. K4-1]|nr:T9SS type A sorting domain-containing protein [Mesonia sp. K4-1]
MIVKLTIKLLFILCSLGVSAQTTSIPDQGFEQALIDLGIDSDQTINGQVLTSDVASVTSLDLSSIAGMGNISNIDGIEGFVSLKTLNLSDAGLFYYNTLLDLSSLTNLEEFYFGGQGDMITNSVSEVILNNNPNLNLISAIDNYPLNKVSLKGGDVNITDLDLYLGYYDNYSADDYTHYVCVEVTSSSQANNQQGNYSNWQVNGYVNYSENCNLKTFSSNKVDVQLFPNPTAQQFQFKTKEKVKGIKVYSLSGKEVLKFQNQNAYDVSQLPAGIYFVKIETLIGTRIQKLIKN